MRQSPSDPVAAVTHANPYPYYAELLAGPALAYDGTLGVWVAARAAAVTAVLTNGLCRVRPPAEPVPRALLGSPAGRIFQHLVRMNDGPRQARLKPAVSSALAAFDPARIAGVSRDQARRLAAELAPAGDPRRVADFAFRLPAAVLGELLGVPADRSDAMVRWAGELAAAFAPGSPAEAVERGKEAAGCLLDLFEALAPDDSDEALLANRIGFLTQAYDATAGLIGNGLRALAERPDLRRQVAADPALLPAVLREVLRFDPPVQNTRRFLAEDGEVAGCPLRQGDAVLVLLAAANRDPAVHAEPDRFDVHRTGGPLFTFGIGPHACPGERLALAIARAGIESLLDAGLDLDHFAGPVTYRPSANARIPLWGRATGEP